MNDNNINSKEIEAKLRAVLDATPFPVAIVDSQDDKIEFWSHSAYTLFGHTAPTASGWYEIAYPDPKYRQEVVDRWKPFLEKAKISSGQPINTGKYKITCQDGSVRICELYVTFISENLIVTFSDVTDKEKTENELKAKFDELEKLNKLMVGREDKMSELKQQISDLEAQLATKNEK